VQIYKGFIRARAVFVEPAREHAFARSRFTKNQNRAFSRENLSRLVGKRANRGAGTDERIDGLSGLARLAGELFMIVTLFLQESLKDDEERGKFERLGQKLLRSFLDRPDCQINRPVRGQHKQRNTRIDLSQTRQKIERGAVGQHVVSNDDVRPGVPKQLLRVVAAFCFFDFVSVLLQKITDTKSDP